MFDLAYIRFTYSSVEVFVALIAHVSTVSGTVTFSKIKVSLSKGAV